MSFHLDVIVNFQSLASWPLRVVCAVIFKEPETRRRLLHVQKDVFRARRGCRTLIKTLKMTTRAHFQL